MDLPNQNVPDILVTNSSGKNLNRDSEPGSRSTTRMLLIQLTLHAASYPDMTEISSEMYEYLRKL